MELDELNNRFQQKLDKIKADFKELASFFLYYLDL